MESNIRDIRQLEFAKEFINSSRRGILHIAPRVGKTRIAILAFQMMNNHPNILIAYPDKKIRASWEADFEIMQYSMVNVTFTTHVSLKKYVTENWDLIVLDEIHLLSPAQIEVVKDVAPGMPILGLTGTLSTWTEKSLLQQLHLPVVATYSIDQAIKEGIIADYEITIVRVHLDNTVKVKYKQAFLTEKAMFDRYGWIINKLENQGRDAMFPRLGRMRIIQNSLAKQKKTMQLLQEFKDERVLVFCGLTAIADNLGIPSYHSKSDEKDIFEDFMTGKGNHLAVVKIGNTGVTYKPLNKIIINYFDSNGENLAQKLNRAMSMEYDNPDKIAQIWIVCTTEDVERRWLLRALEFFDPKKIKYL